MIYVMCRNGNHFTEVTEGRVVCERHRYYPRNRCGEGIRSLGGQSRADFSKVRMSRRNHLLSEFFPLKFEKMEEKFDEF